ncbi:MAG TPA: alpha/beta hydrolase [Ktedonobacteraceae bacterium]|nr:alpha/beta hydrolase [Ktedonobacteraceae bacterium]
MQNSTSQVAAGPQRRTAHVIHYNLSYIVQGEEHGPDGAIVLLHDLPSGAFTWEQVMPQLAGLNRAVYAVDMLGYGLSERPWPSDTSIWGHADDLNFLFQQLGLTSIVLVGVGVGGGVAQVLATRLSRDRVAALVLINTICYQYDFAPNWPLPDMEKRQNPDMPQRTKLEDFIKDLRDTLPQGSATPDAFAQVLSDYVDQWDDELGKEMLYQHIRLLIPAYSNSVSTDLRVMGKPALIIWGQDDQQFPLKYAQRLHREIPNSQLVIVPNAGHLILFDAPNAVASALNDFISGL